MIQDSLKSSGHSTVLIPYRNISSRGKHINFSCLSVFSDYVKTPTFVLLNIIMLYIGGIFMLFTVPSSNKIELHG